MLEKRDVLAIGGSQLAYRSVSVKPTAARTTTASESWLLACSLHSPDRWPYSALLDLDQVAFIVVNCSRPRHEIGLRPEVLDRILLHARVALGSVHVRESGGVEFLLSAE